MGLHSAKEAYLKAILVLEKKKGMVRSIDIAGHRIKVRRNGCADALPFLCIYLQLALSVMSVKKTAPNVQTSFHPVQITICLELLTQFLKDHSRVSQSEQN